MFGFQSIVSVNRGPKYRKGCSGGMHLIGAPHTRSCSSIGFVTDQFFAADWLEACVPQSTADVSHLEGASCIPDQSVKSCTFLSCCCMEIVSFATNATSSADANELAYWGFEAEVEAHL